MSLAQPPPPPERRPPPPPPSFGSNNPFRNRASQLPPPNGQAPSLVPVSPIEHKPRPQSRNPFLDVFDDEEDLLEPPTRHAHKSNSFDASSAQRPKLTGAAAELFENLTITDHDRELKRQLNQNTQYQNTQFNQNPDRVPPRLNTQGNQIPSFKGRPSPPPPPGHRHSKSSDSRPPNSTSNSMNPFPTDRERTKPPVPAIRQPPREPPRPRQRRNSDSSIMEVPHDMDNERAKEKERRERRAAREGRDARDGSRGPGRETGRNRGESASSARDKDGGRRPSKPITGKPRKGSPLDVIDKLDVTGIYGSGLFHHDGPFDACNPHRNKNTHRAPMQAFPEGSANNALTGFGPLPDKGDHTKIFGTRNPEAYLDYNMSAGRRGSSDDALKRPNALRSTAFDPVARVDPVHGDETLGLGSSTFLDGAPASRKAILQQLTESQQAEQAKPDAAGLGRKKSLSHKIRGIAAGRPRFNADGTRRRGSDEAANLEIRGSPTTPIVGRKKNENNPFFSDYDNAYDRKGENINTAENDRRRERAPSSPKRGPIGSATASTADASTSGGGGLMKRVRSLSKPKKRE